MDAGMAKRQPIICVIGYSALDRAAWSALFELKLRRKPAMDCGPSAIEVWTAMRKRPDLVVIDAGVAPAKMVDAAEMIKRLRARVQVLVIGFGEPLEVLEIWRGVDIAGYVLKSADVQELSTGVEAVLRGAKFFSNGSRELIAGASNVRRVTADLSPRERELLPLIARGMTLRAAASEMAISYKTADTHRTRLLRKLGVKDRVQLARLAIRERIIEP